MPLTAEQKNLLASGGTIAAQTAIIEGAGLGLLGGGLLGLAFLPLTLGLAAQFNRVRFPRLSPGDIGRAVQSATQGSVISSDQFFGDVVISQPDQFDHLTELVRNSAIRRIAAEQDTSRLFLERRALTERLAETGEERGFSTAIDPSLRGGVFRPTADAPLQFIEGDFLT